MTSYLWPHTYDLIPVTSYLGRHTCDLIPMTSYLGPHTCDLIHMTSYLWPHTYNKRLGVSLRDRLWFYQLWFTNRRGWLTCLKYFYAAAFICFSLVWANGPAESWTVARSRWFLDNLAYCTIVSIRLLFVYLHVIYVVWLSRRNLTLQYNLMWKHLWYHFLYILVINKLSNCIQ